MILMKAKEVVMTNMGFAVLLSSTEDPRALPIFIGPFEAQAISLRLNEPTETPRPMTHDLMRGVLEALSVTLVCVEIVDIKSGTFYAELVLDDDGREVRVDARPSDAIALALRCACPIRVEPRILMEAGQILPLENENQPDASAAPGGSAAAPPNREKLLRNRLERAIRDERYEEAARLRDELAQYRNETPRDDHPGNT